MPTLTLHYHPLASFCWKPLIALFELDLTFERRVVDLGNPSDREALKALWPVGKFPVLVDGDRVVAESSIIVEYLDRHARDGRRMVPADAEAALDGRFQDRVIDQYVQVPMQAIVLDRITGGKGDTGPDRATLRTAYGMLDRHLADRTWLAGDAFGLADCSAAPALFYAGTLEPFDDHRTLAAYADRLFDRPSVKATIAEARPYFAMYPFAEAIPARFLAD